jgi:hypothetical protein
MVQADTEFGAIEFFKAVQKRSWRAVVGYAAIGRCSMVAPSTLYRNGKRGQQVYLKGMSSPLTVSWFWLKRAEGKRELRFVVSTHPYSGVYLVRLGRKRWAIEGFLKLSNIALVCIALVNPLNSVSTVANPVANCLSTRALD